MNNIKNMIKKYLSLLKELANPHIKFCIPPTSGGKDLVKTIYINYLTI